MKALAKRPAAAAAASAAAPSAAASAAAPSAAASALPPYLTSTGPVQTGRGVKGQYVYWITMPMPSEAMIADHDLKKPSDFTRMEFIGEG